MSRFSEAKNSIDDKTYEAFFAALVYYDEQVEAGNKFLGSLDHHSQVFNPILIADVHRKVPGMMANYYQHAQEADAIKEFLIGKSNEIRAKNVKRYKEAYNRELSDRLIEKYADGDKDYIDMRELIGEINLRKERLAAFTSGLTALSFAVKDLIKLRELGIEDAML